LANDSRLVLGCSANFVRLNEKLGVQVHVILVHAVDFGHGRGIDGMVVPALDLWVRLLNGVAIGEKLKAAVHARVVYVVFISKRLRHLVGFMVLTDTHIKERASIGAKLPKRLVSFRKVKRNNLIKIDTIP
jgi:hypothetical protein